VFVPSWICVKALDKVPKVETDVGFKFVSTQLVPSYLYNLFAILVPSLSATTCALASFNTPKLRWVTFCPCNPKAAQSPPLADGETQIPSKVAA